MKKNYLFSALAASLMLFASCSQEEIISTVGDEPTGGQLVRISASLPQEAATRAMATVTNYKARCIMQLVDASGVAISDERYVEEVQGDQVTFEFTAPDQAYQCVFWADYIQENAATEWSKKKLEQSKYMLQLIPARGAAFSYLVYLERKVLEAAGHINNQILAKNLRNQTRIFVVDFFKEQLNHLESKSGIEAKQAYEKAANLYKDYCLFDFVLSIQSTKMELKSLFIQKMDPIHYQELETKFTLEAQTTFSCSGELLKLISGGNPLKPPTSTPTDMVRLKVEELFSQKK